MSTWHTVLAVLGLGAVTMLARSFFFISRREWPIPHALREGLRHAPLAAMAAIVAPQLLMTDGVLISDWRDARLFGAAAGLLWFAWRRGILGTIGWGTAVYLALRLGLGW